MDVSFLKGVKEEFRFNVKIHDPNQQVTIKNILYDLRKDFPFIETDVNVKSKKLAPYEIILSIIISFVTGVAADLTLKLLERLQQKFKRSKISPEIKGLDRIQRKAENYLRQIGIVDFRIIRREDRGLYVFFIFKDHSGVAHHLYVTSFDLRVIEYKRVG